MTQWEYRYCILNIPGLETTLNEFGAEGWELVQVMGRETAGAVRVFFKRPKIA